MYKNTRKISKAKKNNAIFKNMPLRMKDLKLLLEQNNDDCFRQSIKKFVTKALAMNLNINSVLPTAIKNAVKNGSTESLELLLNSNNINFQGRMKRTLLMEAFLIKSKVEFEFLFKVVEHLISKHIDVSLQDDKGLTVFHYMLHNYRNFISSKYSSCEMFELFWNLLSNSKISYDSIDRNGRTILHHSILKCSTEIIYMILQKQQLQQMKDIQDHNGQTIVHLVANLGDKYLPMLKTLISVASDINVQDYNGRTALHIAAKNAYPEILNTLLQAGADYSIKDKEGLETEFYLLHSCYQNLHTQHGIRKVCALLKFWYGILIISHDIKILQFLLAILSKNIVVLQSLLNEGIKINLVNNYDKVSMNLDYSNNNVQIINFIDKSVNRSLLKSNQAKEQVYIDFYSYKKPVDLVSSKKIKKILESFFNISAIFSMRNNNWMAEFLHNEDENVDEIFKDCVGDNQLFVAEVEEIITQSFGEMVFNNLDEKSEANLNKIFVSNIADCNQNYAAR